ncbi:LysR family transcriptional regulator [Sorangium cellulosum]|uniref:LysR family transcriptional regulator n=1 Tax=Sorangium cellulosum TaxID=56 RepID=A0A150PIQ1_SORCE|nr:LysR family transcriptional regulator [Sorangium cellulosum]
MARLQLISSMGPMHPVHLASIDLNLLVVFDALLAEGSVTRAAARVGLSQSAMSHALGRLRALIDDPVLVRTPRGMIPTPRAQELAGPIREALAQIEATVARSPRFDPATARRSFSVATVDYVELILLPRLVQKLFADAPFVDLVARPYDSDLWGSMETGKVDLAIGMFPAVPAGFYRQRLLEEHYTCVVRRDHPVVRSKLTLKMYTSLPHALISPRGDGGGRVDEVLAEQGLSRRVALQIPHFLVAAHIVAQTDLVLTVPARIAQVFADMEALRVMKPPVELGGFSLDQVWHERQAKDPAHMWLRGIFAEAARDT